MKKINKLIISGIIIILTIFIFVKISNSGMKISKNKRIQEYDYIWVFLNENMNKYMLEAENTGIDLDKLYEYYKNQISKDINFEEYYNLLDKFFDEFETIGHIELIKTNTYFERKKMYEEYIKDFDKLKLSDEEIKYGKYNIEKFSEKIFNKDVENTYKSIDIKSNEIEKNTNIQLQNTNSPNISIKTYRDKSLLYIKYPNFDINYRDSNAEFIKNQLNDFPYEKVVIDIYNNPGGDSVMWIDLVKLLSNSEIKFNSYELYEGKEAIKTLDIYKKYFGDNNLKKIDIGKIVKSSNTKIEIDKTVKNKPMEIYLIQGNNYSASEEFCDFVNKTNWATSVGEKVGGSGQGDPNYHILPISKLLIYYNSSYPSDVDGNTIDLEINPDIELEYNNNFMDYF